MSQLGPLMDWEAADVNDVFNILFADGDDMNTGFEAFMSFGTNPGGNAPSLPANADLVAPALGWGAVTTTTVPVPTGATSLVPSSSSGMDSLPTVTSGSGELPSVSGSPSLMAAEDSSWNVPSPSGSDPALQHRSTSHGLASGIPAPQILQHQATAPQATPGWGTVSTSGLRPTGMMPAASMHTASRQHSGGGSKDATDRKRSSGITKPYRDKNRETREQIRELEKEIAGKLQLVQQLEAQNQELKRRERVLQLSVETTTDNLESLQTSVSAPLMRLLTNFRSVINKSAAERILAKTANVSSVSELTIDTFRSAWTAIVGEMGEMLLEDATVTHPQQRAALEVRFQETFNTVMQFVMAICAQDCSFIVKIKHANMNTGEELPLQGAAFYEQLIAKMQLRRDQVDDILGAWALWSRCAEQNLKEREGIKKQLAESVAASVAGGTSPAEKTTCCTLGVDAMNVVQKLNVNLQRARTLGFMMSFMALRVLTPIQACVMSVHSMPAFPNPLAIVVTLASQHGLCDPYEPDAYGVNNPLVAPVMDLPPSVMQMLGSMPGGMIIGGAAHMQPPALRPLGLPILPLS